MDYIITLFEMIATLGWLQMGYLFLFLQLVIMMCSDKYVLIKNLFEKNKNEPQAIKMANYMRNLFKFYGIESSKRKSLYKDLLKQEKINKVIDWDFLDRCYQDEYREFQYLVYDYLLTMKKYITFNDVPKIKTYIQSKEWWDTIDFFSKVIGNIGMFDNKIDDLMLEWSLDEDFWLRRIAIDHQLGRKEKTNHSLLEKIITNNLGSEEFFINKAIGWSLREYSKTNPKWVRAFIDKYHLQMNKLSIKEASKYIQEEDDN